MKFISNILILIFGSIILALFLWVVSGEYRLKINLGIQRWEVISLWFILVILFLVTLGLSCLSWAAFLYEKKVRGKGKLSLMVRFLLKMVTIITFVIIIIFVLGCFFLIVDEPLLVKKEVVLCPNLVLERFRWPKDYLVKCAEQFVRENYGISWWLEKLSINIHAIVVQSDFDPEVFRKLLREEIERSASTKLSRSEYLLFVSMKFMCSVDSIPPLVVVFVAAIYFDLVLEIFYKSKPYATFE